MRFPSWVLYLFGFLVVASIGRALLSPADRCDTPEERAAIYAVGNQAGAQMGEAFGGSFAQLSPEALASVMSMVADREATVRDAATEGDYSRARAEENRLIADVLSVFESELGREARDRLAGGIREAQEAAAAAQREAIARICS